MAKISGYGAVLALCLASAASGFQAAGTVSGELKKWHRVTVTFDGPSTSEGAAANPYRDYRLNVTFAKGGRSLVVPGFYAADGNAGETGVTGGNKWRVHFSPDEEGTWTYSASFRSGTDIAVSTDPAAGTAASFNGAAGSFAVGPTDKSGRDHRAKGRLRYVGKHHLQFAQSGEYFIKGGADSPENFLAYADFDQTPTNKHSYGPHANDWQAGDPTWKGGKGKNIIGALNYLAGKGMNSVYFLTMNVQGDGNDVWPWTGNAERYRFDCSKLDQWEIVFSHMDRKGIMLHVVTQETENDQLLDGGNLGVQRKLYYREMVARFGHHLALKWNIGEENTNTDGQRKAFADFIRGHDPYDSPIVIHTYPGQYDTVYTPLLGHASYEGPSLQMGDKDLTHGETVKWVQRSSQNGRKWMVCLDEIGPANDGVVTDGEDFNHDGVRKGALWGNLMGGGAGCEWYFGYGHPHTDLTCEDWRSRDNMWNLTRHALDFFRLHLPFSEMAPSDGLTSSGWCLAKAGQVYAVYLPNGGSANLQVGSGTYGVQWYNPRAGGGLQNGSVTSVTGPATVSIGIAPGSTTQDWAVLVKLTSGGGGGAQSVTSFTLVNADSDLDLGPLNDGATINLATLPTRNLNVRSNTNPALVGSVRFGYDGNASHSTENSAPYALAGDSGGNYNAWTPTLGSHSLTATPYTESGATGTAGTPKTVGFTVVDNADAANQAPVANAGPDRSVTLPNPASLDGSVSDDGLPNPPGSTTVSWSKVSGPGTITFGTPSATDTTASFSAAGTYVLRLTANDSSLTDTDDVTVTVASAPADQAVTSFTLINADTDQPIQDPFNSGAVINLGTLPTRNLNVRANTSPSTVGSVRFAYDGNSNYRVESSAPYALEGDTTGDYNPWTPTVGSHSLGATPFTLSSAGGAAGTSKVITFTVVDDPATANTPGDPDPVDGGETVAVNSAADDGGGSGGSCGALGLEVLLVLAVVGLLRRGRRLTGPLAGVFLAAFASAAQAQDPVYQESGGIVVVEIESHATAGGWARETSLAGYTGSAYYTWRGGDLFNSPGSGVLRYRFNLTAGGTYYFRFHNRHDFPDSTLENDCFTRMDGGAWVKTFSSTRGEWTWATNHEFNSTSKPAAQYTLTAGEHTLEISGRSGGFSIDRFHLYLGSVVNPLDTSRPQSSTTPGETTPPPTETETVTALALINADTDAVITGFDSVNSGAVLNLGTLPTRNVNIRGVTSPATVGSVVFAYDGNGSYRTENGAPYALAGDTSGNYNAWTPAVGNHSVRATPYTATGGTGSAGTSRMATFSVIDDPTTPSTNGEGSPPAPDPSIVGGGGGGRDNDNGDAVCGIGSAARAHPMPVFILLTLAALLLVGSRGRA